MVTGDGGGVARTNGEGQGVWEGSGASTNPDTDEGDKGGGSG